MILLILSLAAAQDVPLVSAAAAQKDPLICQIVKRTGSRIAKKRVCRTASDWKWENDRLLNDLSGLQNRKQPEKVQSF